MGIEIWRNEHSRRKFRSQTSDNMERWKSSQQGEESEEKRPEERRCRCAKIGKLRNTGFFHGFVAPEGWKVGSLKRRVRRHLGRWEMKSCTPLWREADFEVKRYKTPQRRTAFGSWDVEKCTALWREAHLEVKCVKNWGVRSSFGSWDDEKVHGVVARSTFRSQNVQNTPWSDHFWKLRCRKSARRCGVKHVSKSTCTKHQMFAPLLEVQMSFRVAGARDCAPLQKWAKRQGSKTMASMGHLTRIYKDAFSVAGAVQKTCSWEMLRGQGADFLRGVAFWCIRCAGLLIWFCVTGAALRMTWHQFSLAGAVL